MRYSRNLRINMKFMRMILLLLAIIGNTDVFAQLIPFFSEGNNKYGYKNSEGKEVVAPKYDLAYPFIEGMAAVRRAGKYGYLDEKGKEVVTPKYDFTWRFIGGYAAVKLGDKYGFIDRTGKEVVPPVYEEANNYHGNCCYKGMAHVREKGRWKIIKLPE
jgi:hypothetical protein